MKSELARAIENGIADALADFIRKAYAEHGRIGPGLACGVFAAMVCPVESEAMRCNGRLKLLAGLIIERCEGQPEHAADLERVKAWLESAEREAWQ